MHNKQKLSVITLFVLLAINIISVKSQGLFSNGDFENYSSCPNSPGQVYKVNGITACTVTPDYFNCSFMPDDIYWCYSGISASSGTGFLGFFGAPWNATSYQSETAVLVLDAPTAAGNTYQLKFDLYGGAATSSPCSNVLNSTCMQFGFYFFKSTNPVSCPGSSPFPTGTHPNPHVSFEAATVTHGSWNTYTLNYTADDVYDRVLIGFFPNTNTFNSSCYSSDPKSYFYLDNLCIDVAGGSCSPCSYAVNAGSDISTCTGDIATMNAVISGGVVNTTWSTSGDGIFSNSSSLNPTYTPGPSDIASGSVTLTITTDNPGAPCSVVSDNVVITIISQADATIVPQGQMCNTNSPVNLTANTGGGIWSGTGITNSATGIFDPAVAGAGIWSITYTIGGNCGDSDNTTIDVEEGYSIDAGIDFAICESQSAIIVATTSGGILSTTWTTSGDGIFDDAFTLNTIYTPGINDISNGSVNLSITTDDPGLPCSPVSDTIIITITPTAVVTINPQDTLCISDTPVILSATTTGGIWNGTGITDSVNGYFTPSISGAGSWNITYNAPVGCGNTATTMIVVLPSDDAGFSYGQLEFCLPSENPFPVVTGMNGGVFSISNPGIIDPITGQIDLVSSGVGSYQITYTTNGLCPQSSMESIEICSEMVINIPNVFTPNNDNNNDKYTLTTQGITQIKGTIVNRWGNQMVSIDSNLKNGQNTFDAWDGTTKNGKNAEDGVYFYLFELTNSEGTTEIYQGTLQLYR